MVYIFLTILLTVYGQLVIKWQVLSAGVMPAALPAKIFFFINLITKPWVLSGFAAAFLASISWMMAMSRFQLSFAYPFMSLSFVLVMLCSAIFFSEPATWQKIVGLMIITTGLCVASYK